jgi:putative CocE/NonD family hydrolase
MRIPNLLALASAVAISAASTTPTFAQALQDQYRKVEYNIPMRDGRTLYTAVYIPRNPQPGKLPILLERTPYGAGPYGPNAYRGNIRGSKKLHNGGYIFAFQDVRGKGPSQGAFVNIRPQLQIKTGPHDVDESTDTYDTVDYLIKNVPDNNARVGLWGISYPGFYAGIGAINTHPALKAVSPQAPVSNWYIGDDFHHNGALMLMDAVRFATFGETTNSGAGFGFTLPGNDDAYANFLALGTLSMITNRFFTKTDGLWKDFVNHPDYDDFWQARALPEQMKNVKCAVLTVGGWYDAEDCWGALNLYKVTEKQNKGIVNAIVMGPWTHGMWAGRDGSRLGDASFGSDTSKVFQDEIEAPFFDRFLRAASSAPVAEAKMFETGGNQWRMFTQWPPAEAKPALWHLTGDKKVSMTIAGPPATLRYVSDPTNPVPHESGVIKTRTVTYPVEDQRFAITRPDVLTFVSDVLTEDVTIAGPVDVEAFVTVDSTDIDVVAKLIDVYPSDAHGADAGDYRLVRGDVMRARYRNSFSNPGPLVPGQKARVPFSMPDVLHRFQRGHRIAVQVHSSWFPLVDRNPQKFVNIYKASPDDFVKANVGLHVGGGDGTTIKVRVLSK